MKQPKTVMQHSALRNLFISTLIVSLVSGVNAQVGSIRVGVPSPTAASLGKYGDIPVSHYTGLPQISIPLYEVRGRTMNLPISLSYQGGGAKVEEIPGWVGMGWSLNAGGVITRSTRGLRDDAITGYLFTGSQLDGGTNWPKPTATYYDGVKGQLYDPEPDQFFFNFGGRSGKFVFGSDQQVYTIPHEKLRFVKTITGSGPSQEISKWTVTDESGVQYVFEAVERTNDVPQGSRTEGGTNQNSISSWYLTKIVSTSGQDEFTFTYSTAITVTHSLQIFEESFHMTLGDPCNPQNVAFVNNYEIGVRYLESIISPNHTVSFTTGSRSDGTGEKKLDYFRVLYQGQLVKKFVLDYDYQSGDVARLRLTKVHEEGVDGKRLPAHIFTYDNSWLPAHSSKAMDHWGFYNGQTSNSSLIPSLIYQGISFPGANRGPSGSSSMAGTLTKITYPTGGNTQFTYEPHDYGMVGNTFVTEGESAPFYSDAYSVDGTPQTVPFTIGGIAQTSVHIIADLDPDYGVPSWFHRVEITNSSGSQLYYRTSQNAIADLVLSPGSYKLVAISEGSGAFADIDISWTEIIPVKTKTAGGVRIKKIEHYDGMSTANNIIKEYTYRTAADPDRSSGVLVSNPKYHYWFDGVYCDYLSRSSVTRGTLGTTQGSHIGYNEVTEKIGPSGQQGYVKYTYRSAFDVPDYAWAPDWWPMAPSTSQDWMRGQIERKEDQNSSSQTQQTLDNGYNFPTGVNYKLVRAMTFKTMIHNYAEVTNYWAPYEVIAAWYHPISETTTRFDQSGQNPVASTKEFFFENSNHVQMTKVVETGSDGRQRITKMKYPLDYTTTSPSSADPMVRALDSMKTVSHMHGAVIEKWTIEKNGASEKVLSADLVKFMGFRPNQILPRQILKLSNPDPVTNFTISNSSTSAFSHDSRYLDQGIMELYDAYGQIKQGRDASNIPISTKWSFNQALPVATIVNGTDDKAFVDEFGDGNYDGWSLRAQDTVNTYWAVQNGVLVQTNYASAGSEENDRILYDLGVEVTDSVILEYDIRISDSNNWDMTVGMGGDTWLGGHSGPEEGVWTAINNETWYYLSSATGWTVVKSGLVIGKTYHFKIVAKGSTKKADYYVDGVRLVKDGAFWHTTTSGIQKISFGNYGYGSITSTWFIDNIRLYPASALVTSQSYIVPSLNVSQTQDENGVPTSYEYDPFQRFSRQVSFDNRIINDQMYFYSRESNGDIFSSTDPNFTGVSSYPGGVSKDGLAGCWRFEGNTKDESGNNNSGTLNGNAALKKGYSGSGVLLDGSGDWVGSPHSSSLNISGSKITISAWVKFNVANSLHFIVEKMATTGRQYYMWWYNSVGLVVGYHDGTVFRDYIYSWAPTLGTWYHLAWTADGSNVRIYVNGVMVASPAQVGVLQNTTSGNCDIGRNAGGAYYFNGVIDEVRVYNRTLAESEIKSMCNALVSTDFADGLGRGVQNQIIFGNNDIVTQKTYDLLGREKKGYKSYLATLNNNMHKYDANYVTNSNAYYSADGGAPFSEIQYLAEPSIRPQMIADPGTAHKLGSGNEIEVAYFSEPSTNRIKKKETDEDNKTNFSYIDRFGYTVRTVVDSGGLNLATHFDYDVIGKMTKSTTPSGLVSTYLYNTVQQLRQKVSPDAGTWSYLYDQGGNLRLITDGNGQLLYKKYDPHQRVIEEGKYTGFSQMFNQTNANDTNFPTSSKVVEKTFSYDFPTTDALASSQRNVSGRVAVSNSYDAGTWKWTTFYSYNELGFVEWIVQKNAWGKAWKITYDRDLQGRETKKGFADSYNGYNLYTFTEYDMAGRIKKVSTNSVDDPITATKEAEYTHTATNKPSTLILGNTAQTISYSYNERDFVKTISSARFTQTLYYHDAPPFAATTRKNGNIAAMTTNYAALGQMGFAYTYDNSNRLTVAQTWLNSGSWATSNNFKIATIGYNGAGNITAMQRYGFNGSIMDNLTYNYVGGTNRLNYITDAVASGSFTTDIDNQSSGNYSYDGNGSALQDLESGITSISYSIRNLPYGLVKNSIPYTYNYDASDSRVYSSESNRFYVNGADGKTEAVVDVSNNALITHNIWGNDLVGQVKRNGGFTRFYHLKDHLGSIRVTLDVSATDVARDDYDLWGMLLETRSYNAGQADVRYKFIGKEKDPQTGLDYFGARYYDSRIARWLSVDPMATVTPDRTPYHFTSNNPINRIDSDGKIDWPLKGNVAVNKRDYRDGARSLRNTIVRTSTYLDTDRPPGATNPHIGVDYRANVGDAFYSLGDGTVREIGETSKGAKFVTVEYGNGDRLSFLHINKVSDGLKVGHVVFEGQQLGETGKTGAELAHLHVDATDKKEKQIDPEKSKYGSTSNKEFFGKFSGDYRKLKQVKDLEKGMKGSQSVGLVPAAF